MSTKTQNYGLIKPELTDAADITATNPNWDKIDSELTKQVGKRVEGNSLSVSDGEYRTAKSGAEIFNDYRNRSYYDDEGVVANGNVATGSYAHAEGEGTTASDDCSHAEGDNTKATEFTAHAEGYRTTASGKHSHAEGRWTTASSDDSHAEGNSTVASGGVSHAEGLATNARGDYSHSEGYNTVAVGESQHVQGKCNIEDTNNTYAHIVGNGSGSKRSNAHTLDWSGNAWFAGDVYVGGTAQSNGDKLVKQSELPKGTTIDTTLTKSGQAADAKATGDAINNAVNNVVDNLELTGKSLEGTSVAVDFNTSTQTTSYERALQGAEIFNDYEDRSYMSSGAVSRGNVAVGLFSHAEGYGTTARGNYSHAEGSYTTAKLDYSHAEGCSTTANSYSSHAEGEYTTTLGDYAHAEGHSEHQASKDYTSSTDNDTIINDWLSSQFSLAKGLASHVEGVNCLALGDYTHVEGTCTVAKGNYSHAEGNTTRASGNYSHAEGLDTTASGECSHAEGYFTTAKGYASHAQGYNTTAQGYAQTVVGKYNVLHTGASSYSAATDTTIFMVGVGTSDSTRANAFRVTNAGKCVGSQSFAASGADYSEYWEWIDGNPDNEDRRGYFVTLDGDKIRKANAEDDYILGVISATPSVIGNAYTDNWQGMYVTDIFGERIKEEVEVPETTDEETGEIIPAYTETRFVINPEYDCNKKYIGRDERKEWSAVGSHGQLVVIDDGSCQVNGYCKVSENGTATASEIGYRVIARLDETHIKIFIR